jgi:hypothetical protein
MKNRGRLAAEPPLRTLGNASRYNSLFTHQRKSPVFWMRAEISHPDLKWQPVAWTCLSE